MERSASVQKEPIGSTATLELQFIRSVNVTADLIQSLSKGAILVEHELRGVPSARLLSSWHRPLIKPADHVGESTTTRERRGDAATTKALVPVRVHLK